MLHIPSAVDDFAWQLSSNSGVRIAAGYGDTLTPGNNSKGTYVQLFTALANDVYGITIHVNSGATSAAARDMIIDIGVDPAGGSSYSVLIPDLYASNASPNSPGSGIDFYFPIFIRAGSTVAARASVNNATVGTVRVWAQVYGMPRRPDLIKVGSKVTAYGIVAASSRGTVLTPGTTSDGAYVSLGTPTVDNFYWAVSLGVNDSTTSDRAYTSDLAYGDASNKHIIIEDALTFTSTSENIWQPINGVYRTVKANIEIFGRSQSSGTLDAAYAIAAYGVS